MGKPLEITGNKYGDLTALYYTGTKRGSNRVWRCLCSCGNTIDVTAEYLQTGHKQNCGCKKPDRSYQRKDLTGQRFGRLVALKPTRKNKHLTFVWLCQCDCGNQVEVPCNALNSGNTKSCGCIRQPVKNESMIGKKYGKLTVLSVAPNASFLCKCDCGRETTAFKKCLLSGVKRSCGCLHNEPRGEDLSGRTFDYLTVLERTETKINGCYAFRCRCKCGNECIFTREKILSNRFQSCGCMPGKNPVDLTGRVFGDLTALRPMKKDNRHGWLCRCVCGKELFERTYYLTHGRVKSCGCREWARKDLSGQRFGKLTAIERTEEKNDETYLWRCRCDCGNEVLASVRQLTRGEKMGCGCTQ